MATRSAGSGWLGPSPSTASIWGRRRRILGLVGPTAQANDPHLSCSGLTSLREIERCWTRPWTERDQLMQDVSFIADVPCFPRWIRVTSCSIIRGCHPRFIAREQRVSSETAIKRTSKVRELSKGMVARCTSLGMASTRNYWCWITDAWPDIL